MSEKDTGHSERVEYQNPKLRELSQEPQTMKTLGRRPVDFWYTDLPPQAMLEVAKVLGALRLDPEWTPATWKHCSLEGQDSALNHAVGHLFEAMQGTVGCPYRIERLAKVAANLLFQIERELYEARESGKNDPRAPDPEPR